MKAILAIALLAGVEWQPIGEFERTLDDDPLEKGAPAIILLREWHHDDTPTNFGTVRTTKAYERVKVLTEEGRKYGDVEIPYVPGKVEVKKIRARVAQPDGRAQEIEPKPIEKTVLKHRRFEIRAKSFSLPDVKPGSIVEYQWEYRSKVPPVTGDWPIQDDDLTIWRGRYSVTPLQSPNLHFSWVGVIPPWLQISQGEKKISLDAEKIPRLAKEPLMPPKESQRYRVELFYTLPGYGAEKDFWRKNGELLFAWFEAFTKRNKPVEKQAAILAVNAKDDVAKARAVYDYVQSMRNLTHDPAKDGESLPKIEDVGDVLKHQMGDEFELTATFVALCRALKLEADVVLVGDRERKLFDAKIFDIEQLDSAVARVFVGLTPVWLDPATPMAPYGLIAWQKTGLEGMRLKAPTELLAVPMGTAYDGQTTRTAKLALAEDGTITGTVDVALNGLAALAQRFAGRKESPAEREKRLADWMLETLPAESTAKVTAMSGWDEPSTPLKATFEVEIPGIATPAGGRILVPVATIARLKNPFDAAKREHPILYPHPFVGDDDVTLSLPAGWKAESTPKASELMTEFGRHRLTPSLTPAGELKVTRRFAITAVIIGKSSYADLRDFYRNARTNDDAALVLRRQ